MFTDAERHKLQGWMNEVYGVFKGHVVAARGGKLKKPIDELAAGRVFTGQQTLELDLFQQKHAVLVMPDISIRDASR